MPEDNKLEGMDLKIEHPTVEDAREMLEIQYEAGLATAPLEKYGIPREKAAEEWKITDEKVAAFAQELANAQDDEFFIALDGQRIVGRCRLTWQPERDQYRFREFFVRPGYTGKGVGSKIWKEVKKTVGSRGVYLLANVDNQNAIDIYKRWGFESSGVYEEGTPFIEGAPNRMYTIMVRKAGQ
jgi:GNAT superfamily N-acetyltransferase